MELRREVTKNREEEAQTEGVGEEQQQEELRKWGKGRGSCKDTKLYQGWQRGLKEACGFVHQGRMPSVAAVEVVVVAVVCTKHYALHLLCLIF